MKAGNTSAINMVDAFHETDVNGPAKVGFGYGIIHNQRVYLYFQEDPCPCNHNCYETLLFLFFV